MPTNNSLRRFGKDRTQEITDGIFAFAMTLLAINIEVPHSVGDLPNDSVLNVLASLSQDFLQYIVAFMVLAFFWILHHRQFEALKFVDHRLLLLNFLGLILVALMPFSAELADTYFYDRIAVIFFEANLLLTGLAFYLQLVYAARHRGLLDEEISSEMITSERRNNLIIPMISLLAIILALLGINWGVLLYFLAPFIFILLSRIH
jgi:uncharacterized membrane protein